MKWILAETIRGLDRLYLMRLPGTPAATMLQPLAEEWAKSLMRNFGNPVEKVDAPRIRRSFDELIDKSDKWPSPSQFYKYLRPRPQREALPVPSISKEGMEKGRVFIKEILQNID